MRIVKQRVGAQIFQTWAAIDGDAACIYHPAEASDSHDMDDAAFAANCVCLPILPNAVLRIFVCLEPVSSIAVENQTSFESGNM